MNGPTSLLANEWFAGAPFDRAPPLSIVEVRGVLGGAVREKAAIPTGNVRCQFFSDMIVAWDGEKTSPAEAERIVE
jgi:hypothetical protein